MKIMGRCRRLGTVRLVEFLPVGRRICIKRSQYVVDFLRRCICGSHEAWRRTPRGRPFAALFGISDDTREAFEHVPTGVRLSVNEKEQTAHGGDIACEIHKHQGVSVAVSRHGQQAF
jgi:hypothetical protein